MVTVCGNDRGRIRQAGVGVRLHLGSSTVTQTGLWDFKVSARDGLHACANDHTPECRRRGRAADKNMSEIPLPPGMGK